MAEFGVAVVHSLFASHARRNRPVVISSGRFVPYKKWTNLGLLRWNVYLNFYHSTFSGWKLSLD